MQERSDQIQALDDQRSSREARWAESTVRKPTIRLMCFVEMNSSCSKRRYIPRACVINSNDSSYIRCVRCLVKRTKYQCRALSSGWVSASETFVSWHERQSKKIEFAPGPARNTYAHSRSGLETAGCSSVKLNARSGRNCSGCSPAIVASRGSVNEQSKLLDRKGVSTDREGVRQRGRTLLDLGAESGVWGTARGETSYPSRYFEGCQSVSGISQRSGALCTGGQGQDRLLLLGILMKTLRATLYKALPAIDTSMVVSAGRRSMPCRSGLCTDWLRLAALMRSKAGVWTGGQHGVCGRVVRDGERSGTWPLR